MSTSYLEAYADWALAGTHLKLELLKACERKLNDYTWYFYNSPKEMRFTDHAKFDRVWFGGGDDRPLIFEFSICTENTSKWNYVEHLDLREIAELADLMHDTYASLHAEITEIERLNN